jgi:histidine triad (HIT) family protein
MALSPLDNPPTPRRWQRPYRSCVSENCVFCSIARGDAAAERLIEDERTVAFMDINPATRGHALVIPKHHCRDLIDANPTDLAATVTTAQRVARAAIDSLQASGVNLVVASGATAFQTVFHLHFHVIPRYPSDGLRQPWTPTPGRLEEIRETASALRTVIQ